MLQANKLSSIKVSNNEKNDCDFINNCQNDSKSCKSLQNYNDFNKSDVEKNYTKSLFKTNFTENFNRKNNNQSTDSGVLLNDSINSLNDNVIASTSKQFESSVTESIDEEEQENDEGIVLNNDLEFSVASFLKNFNASKTKNILSNNFIDNNDNSNCKIFSDDSKLELNKNKINQKFETEEKNEDCIISCDNSETNTNQSKTLNDNSCCSHLSSNIFDSNVTQTNAQNDLTKKNFKSQQQTTDLLKDTNILSLNLTEISDNKEINLNTKNLLNNLKRRKITLPQKRLSCEKKTKKPIVNLNSPKTKENGKVLQNQSNSLNDQLKELDISLEVANSMLETFGQIFSESSETDFLQHISVEEAKSIARLFNNDSEALMTFLNSLSNFFGVKNESVTLELLNNIQNIATQTSENLTTENNFFKPDQMYNSFLDLSKKSEAEKLLTPEQLAFAETFLQMLNNSQTPINLEAQTPIFDSSLFLTPELTSLLNSTNNSQNFEKNSKNFNGNLSFENSVKNETDNKSQRLTQNNKTKELTNFETVVTTNSSTHSVGSPSSSALSSPASTSFSSIASTSSFNAPIVKTATKKRKFSEKLVSTTNPPNFTQNMSNSLIASVVLEALMYSTSVPAALTMLSNDKNVQNAVAEYFALSSSTSLQSKSQEKNFNNELQNETKVTEEMLKTALNNALNSAICDTNAKLNENLLSAPTSASQSIKLSGAQTVASVLEERRRKRPRTTSKSGLASATPLKSVLASSTIKNVSNTLSAANLNLLTNSINGTTVSAAVNNSRAALESGVSVFNGAEFLELSELEEFANSFKKQRIKHGFTQGDIGVALGKRYGTDFSQTTISRFEALNLSYKNMCKLRPLLKEWLEEAEQMIKNGATVVDILEAPSPAYLQNSYSSSKKNLTNSNNIEEKNQFNGLNSSMNSGLNSLTTPRLIGNSMIPPLKRRRKRTNLDNSQKAQLDVYFKANCRPDHQQMNEIAVSLDLDPDVIRVWFCNRRQKLRKIC